MFYCLLFRGLEEDENELLNVSPHTINYASDHTRDQIIQVVNAVWDDGLYITFGVLPSIIISSSSMNYRTDRCLETIRHVKTSPVLFLWMRAKDLNLPHILGAKYAVAFSIASTPGFEALDLSYVLLRFMDKYIREADCDRFKLLSLSYRLGPSATFGVLVFDRRLRSAYQQAWIKSRLDSRYHSRRFDLPLSTWPNRNITLRTPKEVKKLMMAVRALVQV
ncbi:hypothetical protein MVEN_01715300 [Mycena venus]|uniref:Uncharacterized protein n=1 Tax=Mycena venus TaxID=2733690 RepID=A0A8H6XPR8_9AGAR|nr:hypothetical protein MVEN_01715300 [Mycena venus]